MIEGYWRGLEMKQIEREFVQLALEDRFGGGVAEVRIGRDGSVTCNVDRMPGTSRPGRIFGGWSADLVREGREIFKRQAGDVIERGEVGVNISVPVDVHIAMRKAAIGNGMTLKAWVIAALREKLGGAVQRE